MKKIILLFLFFVFAAHLLFQVFSHRQDYYSQFNAEYWRDRYDKSQWFVFNSTNPIGDDGLFTHAAWEYVHGASPLTIVAGYPPLGIYLLGLSILLFNNQYVFAPITGCMVLVMFFLLNRLVIKDTLLAFLPVFVLSFDPLFTGQLQAPYLDLINLFFLLLCMYFFLKNRFVASTFFIACFSLIKFPFLGIFVVAAFLLYLYLIKDYKQMKRLVLALPVIPVVYIAFHLQYFLLGNNLWEFLGAQKWIVNYYSLGVKVIPGIVYPMILFGTWYTWWEGVIRVEEWTILWPLASTLSMLYIFLWIRKRKSDMSLLFITWIGVCLAFLSIIPIAPRYLLLLLPFMYNLAIWVLSKRISLKSLHW